ncbi:MAG: peptidyl-prolyl cis-trans isomerase [Actinobacteria bacterium]|nr:peptidyl-prolyl cis-trans isomerase [Actinomycetota bacterium]
MDPRTSPSRRTALVGLAVLMLLGVSACRRNGPVGPSPVATVDGHEITRSDLTEVSDALAAFVAAQAATQGGGVDDPTVEQTLVRFQGENEYTVGTSATAGALTSLVHVQLLDSMLAAAGETVTAADRDTAQTQVDSQLQQYGVTTTPAIQPFVDLQVELSARYNALQRAHSDPDAYEAQLQQVFQANEQLFREVCIQQIVTADEATARTAAQRVDAGEDFVAVAQELSAEPSLAADGNEQSCVTRSTLSGVFPDEALTVTVGDVIGPADGSGSWLLVRVWDERPASYEDARAQIAGQVPDPSIAAAQDALAAAYATAEVDIDPRFGTWVPAEGQVVAPTDPLAAPADDVTGGTAP